MHAINLRVREETLALARALTAQLGLAHAARMRDALDVGMPLTDEQQHPREQLQLGER